MGASNAAFDGLPGTVDDVRIRRERAFVSGFLVAGPAAILAAAASVALFSSSGVLVYFWYTAR